MTSAKQDCTKQHYEGSTLSMKEKRKHPDGNFPSRARSFSSTNPSLVTLGKKLKQEELSYTSESYSRYSSSSSKSSEKFGESYMKSHGTSKHRREPSKCPYCTVVMTRSHDLRKHVEKLHQGPQEILCHMCDFRATDIVLYLSHENDHLCKCPYCGFVAKNYRGLPRHKTFCRMNPAFQGEKARAHGNTRQRGKAVGRNSNTS